MTRDNLKLKIKQQYGTYSRFCKIVGLDRYEFQRDFLHARNVSRQDIEKIKSLLGVARDQSLTLPDIGRKNKSLREALKGYGGIAKFCRENPEFKKGSVYGAIYQKPGYTNVSQQLIKHFSL